MATVSRPVGKGTTGSTPGAAPGRVRRGWSVLLGFFLLLHGLAHAMPGMRITDRMAGWPVGSEGSTMLLTLTTVMWAATMLGLIGGGLGLLGAWPFRYRWRAMAMTGAAVSLPLLAGFTPDFALPGMVISLGLVVLLWSPASAALGVPHRVGRAGTVRRLARGVGAAMAVGFFALVAAAILLRPWHMRWGSSSDELYMTLPGDELADEPLRYGIQHGVTVEAPASQVWPWLVQLGQTRAGFYSYDWLERLFGARIHNVDRIVPEWQQLAAGDSVFATQPGYLGLFQSRLGWRVSRVDPGRALLLEKWGAFVLVPIDASTTRLIVRTRGGGETAPMEFIFAPAGLLLFELPHFIMERGMLLGIKELAEGRPHS
jgi:hypothetical protein